jgi:hypothetical protein
MLRALKGHSKGTHGVLKGYELGTHGTQAVVRCTLGYSRGYTRARALMSALSGTRCAYLRTRTSSRAHAHALSLSLHRRIHECIFDAPVLLYKDVCLACLSSRECVRSCACACACVRVCECVCACARVCASPHVCELGCVCVWQRLWWCVGFASVPLSLCECVRLCRSVRARGARVSVHACVCVRACVWFCRSIGKRLRACVACACARVCVCVCAPRGWVGAVVARRRPAVLIARPAAPGGRACAVAVWCDRPGYVRVGRRYHLDEPDDQRAVG